MSDLVSKSKTASDPFTNISLTKTHARPHKKGSNKYFSFIAGRTASYMGNSVNV